MNKPLATSSTHFLTLMHVSDLRRLPQYRTIITDKHTINPETERISSPEDASCKQPNAGRRERATTCLSVAWMRVAKKELNHPNHDVPRCADVEKTPGYDKDDYKAEGN